MSVRFQSYLIRLASGKEISAEEAEDAVGLIMEGAASPAQVGAFLMGLASRGESAAEIAGAARAMRSRMARVEAPPGAIDTCGTGGDGAHTLNISTAAALVVAAAGVPVAKHGNRAQSSRAGSADVLEALGVRIDLSPEDVARSIREVGFGFMFAPLHHAAMKNVAAIRRELGLRTLFNLLGPLANPASVRHQLIGVFSPRWLEPLAEALRALGTERAWLAHGGGSDEISTAGTTEILAVESGTMRRFTVDPASLGLPLADPADLKGGDVAFNARAIEALLSGAGGAFRDVVALNAAAALVIAGKANDLAQGLVLAFSTLDSGAAARLLGKLVDFTRAAGRSS
jgi:anthranilate phosphoribosyltransferase